MIDQMGKTHFQEDYRSGLKQLHLNISYLKPGIYTLILKSGENIINKNVAVVK